MMGWSLIYRSQTELEVLFESNKERRVYRDEPGNVVYLEISPHWS
jgi:extracellular factor (EF) 3-hydroxypalmitic acid methyl ester biosynthesis protein